jgi:hypothetical protein
MRILIKDPLGKLPLIGMPGLKAPVIGLIVDKRLNPELSEKYIDPTPEFWDENLTEHEVLLRVPMDQWKGGFVQEYVSEFIKRQGIVGYLSSSVITK